MNTHELSLTLIIIAVVIFAIIRQVMPQEVKKFTFVVFPVLAAYECYSLLPTPVIPVNQLYECLLIVIAGLIAGAVQAVFTKVYFRNQQLYMRGGIMSLVAWIAVILVRFIIEMMFQGTGMFTSFQSLQWILWAGVAATFGSRSIILYLKHPEIGEALSGERTRRHR